MRKRHLVLTFIFFGSVLLLRAAPALAQADTKLACVEHHRHAQELKDEGKFITARAELRACAAEACPGLVREACARLLEEWRVPAVVILAQDNAGADVRGLAVSIDGVRSSSYQDGRALEMDPGNHVLKVERDGYEPHEENVVVGEGDRSRVLRVALRPAARPVASSNVVGAPAPPLQYRPRIPAATYGLGALAITGVAAFGVFSFVGHAKHESLRDHCGQGALPRCDSSDIQAIETSYLVGDVALAVGVVAAAAAVWIYLSRPTPEPPRPVALSF